MLRRVGVAGLVIGAVFLVAGPAWAHVEITPDSAPKGSDAVLAFTVPDESDTVSTTQVAIFFPIDHPIADALVEPIAGWTAKVDTMKVTTPIKTDSGSVTEAVKSVMWSGGKIEPGTFQQFKVSVGLPDVAATIEFKTLQTYSDGTVTRWIESTPPGGAEPDHPTPVLELTAGDGGTATPTTAPAGSGTATGAVKKSDVDSAKSLGLVGVIVGGLGLVVAIGAFLAGRRTRSS